MRWTWVSAGTTGASKQKHMTQAAVFGPTPSQRGEERHRLVQGDRAEPLEVGAARVVGDLVEDAWMRGRLLARQAGDAHRVLHLAGRRARAPRPRSGSARAGVERALLVHVGGAVAQERRDELADRVVAARVGERPLGLRQASTISRAWARVPGRGVAIAIAATLRGTPEPRPRGMTSMTRLATAAAALLAAAALGLPATAAAKGEGPHLLVAG